VAQSFLGGRGYYDDGDFDSPRVSGLSRARFWGGGLRAHVRGLVDESSEPDVHQPRARVQCSGLGVQSLVFGVWCLVFGVWCLVFGVC